MTRGTKLLTGLSLTVILLSLIIVLISIFPTSNQLEIISKITTIIGVLVALGALLVAAAEYYRKKDIDSKESRPYVVASLLPKETSQNIFELKIENTGKTLAKNVSVKFTPDYAPFDGVESMNKLGILKNIEIMTPQENRFFFFGNYLNADNDHSIRKEFKISVKYTDVTGNNVYNETYKNNPTDYHGMIQTTRRGIDDIYKILNDLVKTQKDGVQSIKQIQDTVSKKGVRVRNLYNTNSTGEDLLNQIVNLYSYHSENELWLSPFVDDFRLTIKHCRDKLLSKKILDDNTKLVVIELNHLLETDWRFKEDAVSNHFSNLQKYATKFQDRSSRG